MAQPPPPRVPFPITWVKENHCTQAAEFCLVHLHLPHLGHKLCEDAVKDDTNTSLVGTAAVNVQASSEVDSVLGINRAVGEASNEEFIPSYGRVELFPLWIHVGQKNSKTEGEDRKSPTHPTDGDWF